MIEEKYTEISTVLADRIAAGTYDEKLPLARELASEFEVNVKTAQKAMKVLSDRGLVVTKRGRGSFVVPQAPPSMHAYILPLADDAESPANPWRATVLHMLDAFWQAASRKQVRLTMLPKMPTHGELPPGSVVLSLPWRPPAEMAGLVSTDYTFMAMNFMRDAYAETCDLPFVALAHDARLGIRDAVAHLEARDRRRIAYIEPAVRSQPLLPMLLDELHQRGLPILDRAILQGAGDVAIRELLARGVAFDALIARNYREATAAVRIFTERGISVPGDIAVLTLQAEAADVIVGDQRVTYFGSNFESMARIAMDLLTAGYFEPQTYQVPKILVAGTTT